MKTQYTRRNVLKGVAGLGVVAAGSALTPALRVGAAWTGDGVSLAGKSADATVYSQQSLSLYIDLKNVGATTWSGRGGYGYVGGDAWSSWGHKPLWRDVHPGETIRFGETVTLPAQGGVRRYGVTLTRNGGNLTQEFVITLHVRGTQSGNPFPGGQCTRYALDRMHGATGQWMAVNGNAQDWPDQARSAGWTVGRTAVTNAVLVLPYANKYYYKVRDNRGTYTTPMNVNSPHVGHVAWVTAVNGNWVRISDQSWAGTGQVTENAREIWVGDGAPVSFIYSDR